MAGLIVFRSLVTKYNIKSCVWKTIDLDATRHITTSAWNYSSNMPMIPVKRYPSFVKRLTSERLWDSVTSVSNAGRKKGRGINARKRINLNINKKMGYGKSGIVFPGLTTSPLSNNRKVVIHTSKLVKEKAEEIVVPLRSKKERIPPLLRGYSGRKFPGTSIGPPDPIYDYKFEGFDTIVLYMKKIFLMTSLGRTRRTGAYVVTGNKNGLIGIGYEESSFPKEALEKAKNSAGQKLRYIERFENRTVYHNFGFKYKKQIVFVERMPEGFGIKAPRIAKTVCELLGIKDIYIRRKGTHRNFNVMTFTDLLVDALAKQETHQQLADRTKLNVVEFRPDKDNVPKILASPKGGSTAEPITDENFDFANMYYPDGKIPLARKDYIKNRFINTDGWWKHAYDQRLVRNQEHAKLLRRIHGLEISDEEYARRSRPLK